MRKFTILFLLILSITSIFAWRDNEMEVRVFYNDNHELLQLQNLQPKGDIYPNGQALIYLIPPEFDALKATGLRYQIEREDVKSYAENFWQSQDNTREAYHTYAEIIALADSLVTAFPDICEKYLFGTSVQGRELSALKISDNVSLSENEAEVFFDGGIHGDEVGAAENCIRFARDLCRDYGSDPDITDLVDNREIWIYYMVNPDGRVSDDRTNANGVDCNRDSGYMWDGWGGSSGAFSQPESKALRDCHYNRQFVVHTTYHSGTEYISCPWSYRADQCPDFTHILQLAGEYASSSGYSNMDYGQGNSGMYAINGSTKDTNYGMMGAISWSMEISYDKHPSTSQLMMYYNYNKPAMLSMIEHAGYGLEGVVTDANTGEPVTAAIFIDDYFPCYTDSAAGDFHKYVLAGTYDIKVVANGYETQTITGISVLTGSTTSTDFQLQPLDGQYVYKISASRIPNNNEADEGDTPGVIGAPDNKNYSIGKNGWVILDMQYPIPDGAGNDLIVYEGDTSPEGYSVFAGETIDGPWMPLGDGTGTTEFDLANGNLFEAQFIRIEDDGDGGAIVDNAGFDLDSIESISEVAGTYIAFLGYELDEMVGNGNSYIDPGETIDMLVSVRNNGNTTASGVEGLLSTSSGYVTMNNDDVIFGDITPGQEAFGIFTFTVDMVTPIGELLAFDFQVTANSGAYTTNFNIACMVGISIEDFETNGFLSFDWEFGGNSDWTISTDAYEGSFSAKSGAIGHNSTSSLELNVEVVADGNINFFRKVSSEANYDYLRFYIDNSMLGSWSGNNGWNEETYPVTAGNHTFKWEYSKDGGVASGSDCGWIDYIVLPPIINNSIQGYIEGTVTLLGGSSDVEDVQVSAGGNTVNPDTAGNYSLELFPGIYNVEASLEGYSIGLVEDVIVEAGIITSNIDFTLIGLDPPENLIAEIIDFNSSIILTWGTTTYSEKGYFANDNSRDLMGYNVYWEGNFEANIQDLMYQFEGPFGPGIYEIGVEAVYDEGVSELVEIDIEVILYPVENLDAVSSGDDIVLNWDAPMRGISEYKIYRDGTEINTTTETTYTDLSVFTGQYIYEVSVIYDGGFESDFVEAFINHTDSGINLVPTVTELISIYPNPFNPETNIAFSLAQDSSVQLVIYNVKGQKIKTLINETMESGFHSVVWNGKDDLGKNATSGIYFSFLDSKEEGVDFTSIKKIILLK